ncbi:hypothetical protein [Bradyrhizobium sp. 2S1]|nr:hypothetical protein [Bradyrhizobium sp. 2S1]MCK7669122.1 hypothetical protein [Bradyrhizobium sp. 2S1]MCK7671485.1 hypothetical protein [Bradyrhizobium sp. 2S1]
MREGRHTRDVQRAFDEWGYPTLEILLECDPSELREREAELIREIVPELNAKPSGRRPRGLMVRRRKTADPAASRKVVPCRDWHWLDAVTGRE